MGKEILFKKGTSLNLEDVDYASSIIDRRSTSCYCIFVEGTCELLLLKKILEDLEIK